MTSDAPVYDAFEELSELDPAELDVVREELTEFRDRVYWLTRQIPPGQVATYGQIALLAGSPRAARAVGNLMRTSLERGITLPWHRVVNAKGGISGRGDLGRRREQKRRLLDEGIEFDGATCDLSSYRWDPDVELWERDE
jgi:methylated-DNA-protein-cysteine methyltransferase-like protein